MIQPSFSDFYPQGDEIRTLQDQIRENRMVHALLITGEPGTGKKTLAGLIAQMMLCRNDGTRPCGVCSHCLRVQKREHPDLIVIEKGNPLTGDSRKSKSSIPVDDIREMIRICSTFTFESGNRLILFFDAEDMTPQAQNCLLKTLEEPPDGTFFILTSSHPEQLLTTIRSRCRLLKMKPWDEDVIEHILISDGAEPEKAMLSARAAHGSIGLAKKLASDEDYWKMRENVIDSFFRNRERSRILQNASQWKDSKSDSDLLFDILEECVRMMMKCRLEGKDDPGLKSFSQAWQRFTYETDLSRFVRLLNKISEARIQQKSNVNMQAVTEQLLLSFMGEV